MIQKEGKTASQSEAANRERDSTDDSVDLIRPFVTEFANKLLPLSYGFETCRGDSLRDCYSHTQTPGIHTFHGSVRNQFCSLRKCNKSVGPDLLYYPAPR